MIEIYSTVLGDGPTETHTIDAQQSVLAWLYANGITPGCDLETLPMAVFVDDVQLLPIAWGACQIDPSSKVEIYRVPLGTDPFSITFALLFAAKAALKALMPKIPTASTRSNRSGQGLDEANAKGNKVKLNAIRTECFGRNPQRFPDHATPGRRYFADYKTQRVELCMFVGVGDYEIPFSRIKIAETAVNTLGDDARVQIYGPGADLSGDLAHLNWFPAPEVGPSSSGNAGLALTVSSDLTTSAIATVFTFSGDTVEIPVGSGSFPADWTTGLVLTIQAPYPYTVSDGTGTGGRDVINGDITQLGVPNGAVIEIAGDNSGTYVVFSQTAGTLQLNYLGGIAATGLVLGDVTMSVAYPGSRYKITAITPQLLTVDRLLENGTVDAGWPGWTARTTSQGQVRLDDSNMTGGYRGAFPACPVGELVDAVEWSVLFTTLVGLGRKGEEYAVSSSHQFEYRDMAIPGAPWTEIVKTMTNNSLDSGGYTFREVMPYPMRPECRIKRLPKTGGVNSSEVRDDSQWYSLNGLLHGQSPTSYEDMTVITADIRGGDRLSTSAENLISLECTRMLPVLRAGAWTTIKQPTREISATMGYIARSSGYSDTTDLDIAELERLEATRWTPRGEYYDKIITDQDTVKGYMIECLIPGMSELTIDRGVLTPVRDEARGETFDHIYNPRVMLKPMKRNFVGPGLPDQFDGVDVKYFDHITKQEETVRCRLEIAPGVREPGVKVKSEKLEGVGDRTRAWRYGMRVRRAMLYRQGSYEFETELAGLNSSYMSYAGLGDGTPLHGQNSEVVSYEVTGGVATVGVSTALDWSKPGVYKVLVRRKDGTASGPYIATRVDDKHFRLSAPLDFVPEFQTAAQAPIIQFGHKDKWIYPALITEVQPKGTKTCSLKAVNYDVRMFADDDKFPPADA